MLKSADEMFEELGYKIEESRANVFIIDDIENIAISIHKWSKNIGIYKMTITREELQAINKKCEELGWWNR